MAIKVVSSSTGGGSGTGIGAVRGAWSTSTAYPVTDIVDWLDKRYIVKIPHTSGASFDPTKFTLLGDRPVPECLVGVNLRVFGTSYSIGAGSQGNPITIPGTTVNLPGGPVFGGTLAGRIRSGSFENTGMGGAASGSIAGLVYAALPTHVNQFGLVVFDAMVNDAAFGSGVGAALTGLTNEAQAMIRAAGAGTVVDDQAFSTPFTSTANTAFSSGHYGATSTQNAATSTTFTGTAATLILVGSNSAAGTAQVKVDGVTVATVNLSNQCAAPAVCRVPVELTGLSNTSHTVLVTKTDAGAGVVGVDCLIVPSGYPPAIVFTGAPANIGSEAGRNAACAGAIAAAIANVAAPSPQVLTFADYSASAGWNSTTMLSVDNLHPNDLGHAWVAWQIIDKFSAVTPYEGLNRTAAR